MRREAINSTEAFRQNTVPGITFRQQAEWWIASLPARKRRPVKPATISGSRDALNAWLSVSWKSFIRSYRDVLVGMDFFTTEVLTLKGLRTYDVLFFIHLETRRVKLAGFTPHADQEWMEQQGRNITMEEWGCLKGCRYLLHDRNAKFCQSFRELIKTGSDCQQGARI